MNKEVNFEIAKLLKEKGFDEKTHSFYVIDESEYGELGEFITNPNDNYPALDNNSLFDTLASAPTIAEVVMWLYEKYGIWIAVNRYKDHAADINDPYYFTPDHGFHNYQTPTEAYEAGIKHTLENLIQGGNNEQQ